LPAPPPAPRAGRTLVAVAAVAAAAVAAQSVPLPDTSDAFWSAGNADAQVLLEMHADLLCPDCLAAHPVIQQVIAAYTPAQLRTVYHLFPLPYHTWSFTASYGGNVIKSLNSSSAAAKAWLDWMYAGGQYAFYNDAVAGLTNDQIEALFASAAYNATGVNQAAFLAGLQDPNLNEDTRISWKFGCSRTVTGTPSFFVNGACFVDTHALVPRPGRPHRRRRCCCRRIARRLGHRRRRDVDAGRLAESAGPAVHGKPEPGTRQVAGARDAVPPRRRQGPQLSACGGAAPHGPQLVVVCVYNSASCLRLAPRQARGSDSRASERACVRAARALDSLGAAAACNPRLLPSHARGGCSERIAVARE